MEKTNIKNTIKLIKLIKSFEYQNEKSKSSMRYFTQLKSLRQTLILENKINQLKAEIKVNNYIKTSYNEEKKTITINNTFYQTEEEIHLSFKYPKYREIGLYKSYSYQLYDIFKGNIKRLLIFLIKCYNCKNANEQHELLIKCQNKGYKKL